MLEQKSLFRRIKVYFLFVTFFLSFTGCSSARVWDIPLPDFRQKVENGNFGFLLHIDYSKFKMEEIQKLGPEAPYYFYYIFKNLKMNNKAFSMLKIAWQKSPSLWKEKAGVLLVRELLKRDRYSEALSVAERYLKKYKDADSVRTVMRLRLEALYWQRRDVEVLKYLRTEKNRLTIENSPELKLFKAVVSCRQNIAGWPDLFRDLFFNEKASFIHSRAYAFLKLENKRIDSFMPWERKLFHAKDLLARGKRKEAIKLYEEAFKAGYQKIFKKTSETLKEYAFACLSAGLYREGADYLAGLSGKLHGRVNLDALEMAGRLYRKAGITAKAKILFDRVIDLTMDDSQRDRVLWFTIATDEKRSYKKAFRTIIATYALWSNPDYFSDILESVVSSLVYDRDWKKLYTLCRITGKNGPEDIRDRVVYILNRAVSLGLFLLPDNMAESECLSHEPVRDSAGFAINYYYLLNSYMKGKQKRVLDDKPENVARKYTSNKKSADFTFIKGFMTYGMFMDAYGRAKNNGNGLKGQELFEIAGDLMSRGFYRQSLNLMRIYFSRQNGTPKKDELQLYYPEIFTVSIEKYSVRENIPDFILYAVIREESHFDKDIVSRAGAVGLMQLLPVTAKDTARKLKLKSIDLKDPLINLNLGTKHLGSLYGRLNSVPKAILSYNAGLQRLRSWERDLKTLPDDLFIEAVPYKETRDYFKKILISSIFYARLYDRLTAVQAIHSFFPER
ncbi:MAG: lytic transglycosylase domain-containing protein [Spirochaetes bacterium]|nr:lytic transglycosylase domain-containing protein [Spirochaetota bacterium]